MKLNRTALCTVEILELVSKKSGGITLDEIYEKLDMFKTSGYDIVITLVQTGMIHVVREQKQRYTIGLTAYRTGINYANNLDFISTIDSALKAFSGEVGKAVFLGTYMDDAIVCICKSKPENPTITTATVDTKNPTCYMSLGKATMTFTEEEEVRRVLECATLKKHMGRTLGTREESEKEPERIRKERYAFDVRGLEERIKRVGAPVFGQDGNVIGVISVSNLYKPTEDYDTLGRQMQVKAAEVSRLPGFLGKC